MHLEVEVIEDLSLKDLPVREGYIENKVTLLSTGIIVMDNQSKPVSGEILDAVVKGLLKARERTVVRSVLDEYTENPNIKSVVKKTTLWGFLRDFLRRTEYKK